MLERVSQLLGACATDATVMPSSELCNEGWTFRLVLDRFERSRGVEHQFAFLPGAR